MLDHLNIQSTVSKSLSCEGTLPRIALCGSQLKICQGLQIKACLNIVALYLTLDIVMLATVSLTIKVAELPMLIADLLFKCLGQK